MTERSACLFANLCPYTGDQILRGINDWFSLVGKFLKQAFPRAKFKVGKGFSHQTAQPFIAAPSPLPPVLKAAQRVLSGNAILLRQHVPFQDGASRR